MFGYSPRSDRAVQYPVEVIDGRFWPITQSWVMQVFAYDPIRPGEWKFTWEAGHGSWQWMDEEVRFDRTRQLFIERRTARPYPGFAHSHCELEIQSVPAVLRAVQRITSNFDAAQMPGVRSLIDSTPADTFVATSVVLAFKGKEVILELAWLKDASGKAAIEFTTESPLSAVLSREVRTRCKAE